MSREFVSLDSHDGKHDNDAEHGRSPARHAAGAPGLQLRHRGQSRTAAPTCADASRRSTTKPPDAATVRIRVPGRGWRGHRARPVRAAWRRHRWGAPMADLLDHVVPATRRRLTSPSRSKAVADGLVSSYLVHRARPPAHSSTSTSAAGDFMLPAPLPDQGAVRHRRQRHHPGDGHAARRHRHELADVVLVHSAGSACDVIFGEELRGFARDGAIRLIEHHTDGRPRLTAQALTELVGRLGAARRLERVARAACSTTLKRTTRRQDWVPNCARNASGPPPLRPVTVAL